MSTPTNFNYINFGFPTHTSTANRLKASSSFLKSNMRSPKYTGDFPVASNAERRLRYDGSVSRKSFRLNVLSITKGSEMPLQQQNFIFMQYHIHTVTGKCALVHLLCLLQVANCENN